MTNEIDHHVGKRLRRRRRLLGLTQSQLADAVGIRFQQVQKYECGANRVSASRLFELAEALDVPVQYFYEGIEGRGAAAVSEEESLEPDILVELQRILLGGAQSLPNVLDPARVAEDLGYVTQTLAGVVGSLANSTLPGDVDDAVLMPVAGLLLDVTASLNALSSGDTQAFAQQLVDSVAGLVDALAERLGPLGVILNPVNALLTPALNALAALLGGLLGIVL